MKTAHTTSAPINPLIEALTALNFGEVSATAKEKLYQFAEKLAVYDTEKATIALKDLPAVLQTKYRRADIEYFIIAHLDEDDNVLYIEEHAKGTIDSATVHPREVMKSCLKANSVSVLFFHNHPSGNPEPSRADVLITKSLSTALSKTGVYVKDHQIIGNHRVHSLNRSNPEAFFKGGF